jgi:hypothetical protein
MVLLDLCRCWGRSRVELSQSDNNVGGAVEDVAVYLIVAGLTVRFTSAKGCSVIFLLELYWDVCRYSCALESECAEQDAGERCEGQLLI